MDIRKGILSLGVTTVFAGQIVSGSVNENFYQPGIYYYGDNTTEVNYQSIYNEINEDIPSGFTFSTSAPKFNSVPTALKDYKKIGNRASFFQEEVDFNNIADKSEYTFGFAKPVFVYVPLDCKVTSVSPNVSFGKISNFDSYFTGQGVTCTVLAEDFDSEGKQIEIKITYSNLSKNWQSIGLSESYKDKSTNRELFYSDFVDGISYEFKAGTCIAETGTTGSYSEIEDCSSYVTIHLEKRVKGNSDWKEMNFGEFFTTLKKV